MRKGALVAIVLGLLALGCSDEKPRAALDPWRAGAQGLPIPASAEVTGEDDPTNQTYTVPGTDFEALTAWYEEQLPEGEDWEQWAWCEQKRFTGTLQKTWHIRGTPAILTIVISDDEPPGLNIGRDDSGPC